MHITRKTFALLTAIQGIVFILCMLCNLYFDSRLFNSGVFAGIWIMLFSFFGYMFAAPRYSHLYSSESWRVVNRKGSILTLVLGFLFALVCWYLEICFSV